VLVHVTVADRRCANAPVAVARTHDPFAFAYAPACLAQDDD